MLMTTMIMKLFHWGLFLCLLISPRFFIQGSRSTRFINTAKIQHDFTKARVRGMHDISREKAQTTKPLKEEDLFVKHDLENRLDRSTLSVNDEIVELYCRSTSSNFWHFYKEIAINPSNWSSPDMMSQVKEGGIESEVARKELDHQLRLSLHGNGMGVSPILLNIQKEKRQFRKIKPYHLKLGYRLPWEDSITILDRKSNAVNKKRTSLLPAPQEVIDPQQELQALSHLKLTKENTLDILEVVKSHPKLFSSRVIKSIESVDHWIAQLVESQQQEDSTTLSMIRIAADGSAIFASPSSMNGEKRAGVCLDSQAGIVCIPHYPIKVLPSNNAILDTDEDETDKNVDNSSVDDDSNEEGNTSRLSKENKSFQSLRSSLDWKYAPLEKFALSLRVEGVASLVNTPFDAEIFAGIASLVWTNLLLTRLSFKKEKGLDVMLNTDSKALCKLLRSSDSDESKQSDEVASLSDVLHLAQKAVTRICSSSNDDSKWSFEWVNGHPERREDDANKWDLSSSAIYIADELCREVGVVEERDSVRQQFQLKHKFDFDKNVQVLNAKDVLHLLALLNIRSASK